jgi:putative transposase
MKASQFSEAQKAFILKQGRDGMPVAEICRKAGISQATYFNWKKKYDGLLPTEMRRLKQLEDENNKDAAGRDPAKTLRPVRKRKLVDEVRGDWNVSIRRACRVLLFDTSSYHYKSRRPGQAVLEQRIKEICQTRVRYGYRRVHVLLCREGWRINHKKTYRVYREMGLQLRNKTPKRRVKAKLREDRKVATRPNETWAMDFVHDQLATGRKIRVLTVVDTFSRYAPTIDPRLSYRGEDVVQVLEKVCAKVGYPTTIRVDQGTEFVSRDLDLWAYTRGVTLDFSRPGKPTDNAFIEAFNGRFRAECLNAHWFMSLEDARQKMEAWRRYYNEERPHGAIGQKAPITLLAHDGKSSPPS